MTEEHQAGPNHDRRWGWVLLAAAALVPLFGRVLVPSGTLDWWEIRFAWLGAAMLLLFPPPSARHLPATRMGAVALFLFGLAAPFFANLINASIGD